MTTSQRLLRAGGVVLEWALGVALVVLIYIHVAPNTQGASVPGTSPNSATSGLLPVCGTSTYCLTDDRTGDHITFSCPTGTYTFTHCSHQPIATLSGTGMLNTVNGTQTLTDSKPDRRVNAGFLLGQGTGRAVISFVVAPGIIQTFNINQTIPFAPCGTCP